MSATKNLREQLAALLSWSDAHVSFDDAVVDLPVAARGQVPSGLPYSAWQLVEHLRLTQADILEFCVSPRYEEKHWPHDYWPASPVPPTARAWAASIAGFRKERRALQRLVTDPRRDLLAKVPAGTGQTLLREVILAADHAAYHVGQIVAVRRLLGHWTAA
ncbi:MAG: DinB family protein [Acidobacteriia bacterium]|nr:DinB family protein [Terriglobia bacterium]